jgi:hypothetical protein
MTGEEKVQRFEVLYCEDQDSALYTGTTKKRDEEARVHAEFDAKRRCI